MTLTSDDGIPIDDSERQQCEVWTRVMGYFRPFDSFNIGKKQEYRDRVCFDEPTWKEDTE